MRLLRRYRQWKSRRRYQKAMRLFGHLKTSGKITAEHLDALSKGGGIFPPGTVDTQLHRVRRYVTEWEAM